jgi:hypothetical protein
MTPPRLLAAALLPCLLLLLPLPTRAATPLAELLVALKREAPASESFQEVRYRRALSAPLVTAGALTWRGGMAFERRIDSPWQETGILEDGTLVVRRGRGPERIVPLARAPELQALFGGLSALFAGDGAALERQFEVELAGDSAGWRLTLAPRAPALRAKIAELELRGDNGRARCLVLRQPAAQTLTLFGAAVAPAPAAGFEQLVARDCPGP